MLQEIQSVVKRQDLDMGRNTILSHARYGEGTGL